MEESRRISNYRFSKLKKKILLIYNQKIIKFLILHKMKLYTAETTTNFLI